MRSVSRLSFDQRLRVTAALVDGCSIRATERLCVVHRDTVMRWGLSLGEACQRLHDALVGGVHVDLLQLDEIHSFVAKKQRHLTDDDPSYMGDTWTFVGLDAIRKTIVGYRVGKRTGATADIFALDLRQRIVNQPQISSDGYAPYCEAIALSFGREVDYGQVVKQYGGNPSRYRGSIKTPIFGNPAPENMGTSYIERENLTTRMNIRRFARRTNGFSKRLRHHTAAFALYAAHYNFCRVHETLRTTPAVAIGVAERVWSLGELIEVAPSIGPVPGAELPVEAPARAVRRKPSQDESAKRQMSFKWT